MACNKSTKQKVPCEVYTEQFIRFAKVYADKFLASKSQRRWLVEFTRMEEWGYFEPHKLRELFIKILNGTNELPFIYQNRIYEIGYLALEATKRTISNMPSYEIRLITGGIAVNDSGEELNLLFYSEAVSICKEMNREVEEELFVVYNSITNKRQ